MNLSEIFLQSVARYGLQNKKVLLAVSGGLDSAVLCELSKQAGLSFALLHGNFGLRGAESERDETFVRNLGEKYGVAVFVKKFETTAFASEKRISLQEAARDLRYAWFEQVRSAEGFACTLLAHHADDNIETLLLNFFRGTGLDGLTGMPAEKKDVHCLRPMLAMRRQQIEDFALAAHLQWVEDSSNASDKYTRNFFRNELLPQLQRVFPQAEKNLLRNIGRFGQTAALYRPLVAQLKKKICEVKGEEVHLPVLKLLTYKDTSLVYEIIRDFGFGEAAVPEMLKLADAAPGRYIANEKYRIIRHGRWFIVAPHAATAATFVVEKTDSLVRFGDQQLSLKQTSVDDFPSRPSPDAAHLDAGKIDFPLVLRKWKAGDYFYPLGMTKKKKLARFFIDLKLSRTAKEKVWVLESHKRIVWVVGLRIDDRFKLTGQTRNVLRLQVQ